LRIYRPGRSFYPTTMQIGQGMRLDYWAFGSAENARDAMDMTRLILKGRSIDAEVQSISRFKPALSHPARLEIDSKRINAKVCATARVAGHHDRSAPILIYRA